MSSIKDFKDQNGYVLAHAAIPDGYQIGGSLVNGFQHESVPFFVTVHAVNPETKAIIYGLTDEKYTTYKNQMIKMTLKAMSDVKWNSIRDFIEPEVYLDTFAAALSGMPSIKAVGKADLPSICGKNQQQAFNDFMALYQDSFERDASLGTPTRANNILVKSFMRKYDGVAKSGAACTVIAGMDYNGIEYYSEASMLGAISPLAGLLGAAVKNKQAAGSSKKFGQGSPCDAIDWGAKNKFLLVCPKEHERAALVDFMEFVQTFHMDPHLRNQFYQQISQRIQMRMQETARFQSMARAADEPAAAGTDAGAEFTGHVEHDHGLLESEAGFRRQNLPGPFRGDPGRQQLPDHLWAERRCERDGRSRLPGPLRRCLRRLRYSAGSGVFEPE